MNKYNPNIHHRRSIRLKGYDYSQAGLYFITICCQDRAHLFGEIINGEMNLNFYGQIAYEEWLKTEQIRDNCTLHEFIIMPNHIHGIIEISFKKGENEGNGKFQSPSQTIGSFIRGFKIATIKKIKEKIINSGGTGESRFAQNRIDISGFSGELRFAPTEKIKKLNFKIWQRNYYENIIRDHQAYQNISNYIINNPAKWAEDKFHKK
jgi:putative transposase